MEPWHFSHGELNQEPASGIAGIVLQWSHGILAMESSPTIRNGINARALQWSHGILAMERATSHHRDDVRYSRFNGAMAF